MVSHFEKYSPGNERQGCFTELEYQLEKGSLYLELEKGAGDNALPTDIEIETQVLDVNGMSEKEAVPRIEEKNKKPTETFVVIGGIGEDVEVMRPFLKSLAMEKKQVVGISLPGTGESGDVGEEWRTDSAGKKQTTFEHYSKLIYRVLEKLKQDAEKNKLNAPSPKITIIGHSLGGAIVADFAKRYPDLVDHIFLVAPGGYKKEKTLGPLVPAMTVDFIHKQASERLPQIFKKIGEGIPPVAYNLWIKNFLINHPTEKSQPVFSRLQQRFWESYVLAQGHLSKDIMEINRAGHDVNILAGEEDKLFPVKDYRASFDRPGVNLNIIKGSHYGILDFHQETVQKIMALCHQERS